MPAIALYAYPGEELDFAFRTYHGYLVAVRRSIATHCGGSNGILDGVAGTVKAGQWRSVVSRNETLSGRTSQYLRNAWATEVLLNAPRVVGGIDFINFANHWAVVQAYYAIFAGFNALLQLAHPNPPRTHATLLRWAADQVGRDESPFVEPWRWRVVGPLDAYGYEGFPPDFAPDASISTIAAVSDASAPHILARALKTTRDRKIADQRAGWLKGKVTARGAKRKRLTRAELAQHSARLAPTTLFDLLYRLRLRANYDEADAVVSGALSSIDAQDFHACLCDIVAATLLTVEIYLAHRTSSDAVRAALRPLAIPSSVEAHSALARAQLWNT